ncbi:MAG: hypothetical protein KAI24_16300 [Planctomycetes bacterium]|nr:hypothetical protein [Planctomycetota bacterium]
MRLAPLQLPDEAAPVPADVAAFLAGARERIDDWLARPEYRTGIDFIPSDYEPVWTALVAIHRRHPEARRMLEWGSGFGVVTGLGAALGLEAFGIELVSPLVTRSRQLLREHGLDATFAEGSFVPEDFDAAAHDEPETNAVLDQPDGYDELGYDLDDFDLVFAYPWPGEEELYCEIFRRGASPGAILLLWCGVDGARAYQGR